jgi:hypothetical protein
MIRTLLSLLKVDPNPVDDDSVIAKFLPLTIIGEPNSIIWLTADDHGFIRICTKLDEFDLTSDYRLTIEEIV